MKPLNLLVIILITQKGITLVTFYPVITLDFITVNKINTINSTPNSGYMLLTVIESHVLFTLG